MIKLAINNKINEYKLIYPSCFILINDKHGKA